MDAKQTFIDKTLDNLSIKKLPIIGISMVLIMLFHAKIPAPSNTFLKILWSIFCSYGGGIGVTVLIIYLGFELYNSTFKVNEPMTLKSVGQFYKKGAIRILPAYLLIGIIFYAIVAKDFVSFLLNMIFVSFFAGGVRDFWFVAAIIVLYLLYPLMQYFISKFKNKLIPLITLFIIAISIECLFCFAINKAYTLTEIFITRIPAFMIGLFLGYCYTSKDKKSFVIFSIASLVVFIVLSSLILGHIIHLDTRNTRYLFTFIAVLMIIVLSALFIYIPKVILSPFNSLSKRSYEIFLVDVSFGAFWFRGLTKTTSINIFMFLILSFVVGEATYQITNLNSDLWMYIKTKRHKIVKSN